MMVGEAHQKTERGLLREGVAWLRHNGKWWLVPILLALIFYEKARAAIAKAWGAR